MLPTTTIFLLASSVIPSAVSWSFSSRSVVTPSQWNALNSTLGGKLIRVTPFARSCFKDAGSEVGGSFDPNFCNATIIPNYTDGAVRETFPGSYQFSQWESCQATNQNCELNITADGTTGLYPQGGDVCHQGAIPQYFINVTTASDVIKGFAFAKLMGIQPAIKNTGHDLLGRSAGPSQLGFWTHNMRGFTLINKFTPQGCNSTGIPAVKVAAGVTDEELYTFTDVNNVTVPGGAIPTVGPGGGYTMGGGHGPLSAPLGLAVNRALQYEVVTPEGLHLIANECQNSDIFFALNGGGGGTFGVVLNHWTKVLPKYTIQVGLGMLNFDGDNKKELLLLLAQNAQQYIDQGWASFIYFANNLLFFANPFVNATVAEAQLASVKALVIKQGGQWSTSTEDGYNAYWTKYVSPAAIPVGTPFNSGSRLIPTANFATAQKREELVDAMLASFVGHPFPFLFVVSPIYYLKHFGPSSLTSTTPVWGDAPWFITMRDAWDINTPMSVVEQINRNMSASIDILRNITPGSGTYFNEGEVYEKNFTDAYWGSANYAKLLKIKKKYDPNNLLNCYQCVGFNPNATNVQCYI